MYEQSLAKLNSLISRYTGTLELIKRDKRRIFRELVIRSQSDLDNKLKHYRALLKKEPKTLEDETKIEVIEKEYILMLAKHRDLTNGGTGANYNVKDLLDNHILLSKD